MISFFYEPSTRTRASFEIAMRKMGGDVIFSTENAKEFSSVVKGETLEDTMRVLNRYGPDVIVSRFANEGDAEKASKVSSVPVINAGDGCGQHPTQALLDIYTIQKKFDFIDGLTIAMAGDLAKGRTVRSLCYLLGKFKNVLVYFVSPDNSKMRDDIKDYLKEHNVQFRECPSLQEIASKVDVIYQTRPQKERGTVFDLSEDARKHFTVDERIVREMSERSIIMHPLPRTGEITLEVDKDPRAVYLTDQIDSGLFTRMALLKMLCS
jgi:aspartate carbamoyltransferase catalytic subunit